MKLNGKEIKLSSPLTVNELLTKNGYVQNRIAVEINGEILPKQQYESKMVSDGDTVEIVTFMGGG